MKKLIYLLAGAVIATAFTACENEKEPVYHNPTSMKINTPALQNQYLATTADMENRSTFVLETSQPDYGYSAIATYGAQMCLSPDFKEATDNQEANYISLTNQDPNNAVMSLRTYDLAVGMCKLLGIENEEDWEAYQGDMEIPVYFRATCEIPGVEGSFIVSDNAVSYNKVQLVYAVPTAGYIYIVGTLSGEKAPEASQKAIYENFRLIEPVIGSKVYAGAFKFPACDPAKDPNSPDDQSWFRFYTELNGWDDKNSQFGSNEANFYNKPIGSEFVDGLYTAKAVWGGQGNWTIWFAEETWMTIVCSLEQDKSPVVWFKYGQYDVTLETDTNGLLSPVFNEPGEE